jgi:hypothetical protein
MRAQKNVGIVLASSVVIAGTFLLFGFRADQRSEAVDGTCKTCVITATTIQIFEAVDGPESLPQRPSTVLIHGDGHFLMLFYGQTMPYLFGADGKFIREFGGRGQGPGEFVHPEFAMKLPGDSLLVLEPFARRATVFDKDYQPVRMIRGDFGQVLSFEARVWPTLVVGSALGTADAIGFPIHSFDMSGTEAVRLRSFGLEESNIKEFRNFQLLETYVTGSPEGTVWAVDRRRYRLSEWNLEGQMLRMLEPKPLWFSGLSHDKYLFGRRDIPPPPYMAGVRVDDQGRLWLFGWVAADDWTEAYADVRRGPRTRASSADIPVSQSRLNIDRLYNTRVDVLDLRSGDLLASTTLEDRVVDVIAEHNAVATFRMASGEVPTVEVLQVSLVEQ